MSDKPTDKNNTPILIIIICASITMLVQTFSAAITVMGYDEVIQADAKARAAKILGNVKQQECKIDQSLINQINENTLIIEVLLEDTHKPGG